MACLSFPRSLAACERERTTSAVRILSRVARARRHKAPTLKMRDQTARTLLFYIIIIVLSNVDSVVRRIIYNKPFSGSDPSALLLPLLSRSRST